MWDAPTSPSTPPPHSHGGLPLQALTSPNSHWPCLSLCLSPEWGLLGQGLHLVLPAPWRRAWRGASASFRGLQGPQIRPSAPVGEAPRKGLLSVPPPLSIAVCPPTTGGSCMIKLSPGEEFALCCDPLSSWILGRAAECSSEGGWVARLAPSWREERSEAPSPAPGPSPAQFPQREGLWNQVGTRSPCMGAGLWGQGHLPTPMHPSAQEGSAPSLTVLAMEGTKSGGIPHSVAQHQVPGGSPASPTGPWPHPSLILRFPSGEKRL